MSSLDLTKVPKDRPILIEIGGKWTQAQWDDNGTTPDGEWTGWWEVIWLPSHGCGCCSSTNPAFTDWCELPE